MIAKTVSFVTCAMCYSYTFYVLYNLTSFLSKHNQREGNTVISMKDENTVLSMLWPLLLNMSLLSAFMLQHSIMASEVVKDLFFKLGIDYMDRSIYNMVSAVMLHLLINQWQQIQWIFVWKINTVSSDILWLTFTILHILAWFAIYCGCIMADISELAGLKQVYYKFSHRINPMNVKSKELQRYYKHMRHPSFVGFLIILWIHPSMTLDRLLLASILTVYMVLMWTIDQEDYDYHASMIRTKQKELF